VTNEELQKIHDNLYDKYVTEPEVFEREIKIVSEMAAKQAVLGNGTVEFQFGDNVFVARLTEDIKRFSKVIRLVISNENSRKIAGNRYIPYILEAEVDNNLSLTENYKTVFEAFLRHVSGAIEPEVLE